MMLDDVIEIKKADSIGWYPASVAVITWPMCITTGGAVLPGV